MASADDILAELLAAGLRAWPEVVLSREALAAHLQRLGAEDGRTPVERRAHAADLYLACACAEGNPRALARFDESHLSQVAAFVARTDSSPQFAGEVRQQLRERLLLALPGKRPRIARYSGRGPLGAWLRMAAVRAAVDLKRAMGDGLGTDRIPDLSDANNPEVQLLKSRYGVEYQLALREAWLALEPRERNLLRLHFVDGFSVDRLGATYQVHRATAARWILAARERLLSEMLSILTARLQLTPAELHSLANLVVDDLHVSLGPLSLL